jgi:hypothetical protein
MSSHHAPNPTLKRLLSAASLGVLLCVVHLAFDSAEFVRSSLPDSRHVAGVPADSQVVSNEAVSHSLPALVAPTKGDEFEAIAPVAAHLPGQSHIVVRPELAHRVQHVRAVFVDAPDHLIVLPGTPPPSHC